MHFNYTEKWYVFILLLILCQFPIFAVALETDTHKKINEYITANTLNGFSLDAYLKNQLNFSNGIEEEFTSNKTKKVWEWVQFGGEYEDIPYWWMPYLRSVNHFHNPLTGQGFSGIWGTEFLAGESSIQWSQEPIGTQSPGGHYSWFDVREYFYNALTSTNKTDREKNFTDTFRGLGQLMHLVEDLSVPEHTRDDGHYIFYNYEKWVKETIKTIADISQFTPIYFDSSAIGNPNPLAPVPVANLFDTKQYNGTNPIITTYYSQNYFQRTIGLSEYTNANFLSPDTMLTADFPYPNWSSIYEYEEIIDNTGEKRTYLGKFKDGENINHLAAGRLFYKYLPSPLRHLGLKLDKRVYSDYAQKLIPRAVGYSAGLLDYFFRGKMVAGISELFYDSFCNIIGIKMPYIQNSTNKDAMGPGNLIVSYQYKLPGGGEFIYGTSDEKPLNESIGSSYISSSAFTFNFNNPIPPNAQEIKLTLIFKGKLGNEGIYPYNNEFAVAAQVLPAINNNCSVTYREFESLVIVYPGWQKVAFSYLKINGEYRYEPLPENQVYVFDYQNVHPIYIFEPDTVMTIWCEDSYRNLPVKTGDWAKTILYDFFGGRLRTVIFNGSKTVYDDITGENLGPCNNCNDAEHIEYFSKFEPHCERLTPWEEPPPPP
ncbi:MAG: hypothetical protein C4560_01760 [Nitrospiraceae bacterium]|nr:MAG: hypothetical protein C4560_01760 [Nitrospiraceae bacterium]